MLLKDNIILSHTVLVELERLFFLYLLFRSYYVNGKLDILLRQYYKVFFMFETQKPRNPSAGASVRFSAEKSVSTSSHVHENSVQWPPENLRETDLCLFSILLVL